MEFEWIRQWYVQGARHAEQHQWWTEPMADLLRLWGRLEAITATTLRFLESAAEGAAEDARKPTQPQGASKDADGEGKKARKTREKRHKHCEQVRSAALGGQQVFDAMLEALEDRQRKRQGWKAREEAAVWGTMDPDCRPVPVPWPETPVEGRLDLTAAIAALTRRGGSFRYA